MKPHHTDDGLAGSDRAAPDRSASLRGLRDCDPAVDTGAGAFRPTARQLGCRSRFDRNRDVDRAVRRRQRRASDVAVNPLDRHHRQRTSLGDR